MMHGLFKKVVEEVST